MKMSAVKSYDSCVILVLNKSKRDLESQGSQSIAHLCQQQLPEYANKLIRSFSNSESI